MPFDPYAYDLARPARPPSAPSGKAAADEAPRALPAEAQYVLWQGLRQAAAGALDLWERTPPGSRRQPPAFPVQHAGKPHFDPAALRQQTLSGWHRLIGIEIRLAAEALEVLILNGEAAVYRALLAEECGRGAPGWAWRWRCCAGNWCCCATAPRRLLARCSPVEAGGAACQKP